MNQQIIILFFAFLIIGGFIGFFYRKIQIERKNRAAIEKVEKLLRDTENRAKEMVFEAKNEALKIQETAQLAVQKERREAENLRDRLLKKEELLDDKIDAVEKQKLELEERANNIKQLKQEVQKLYEEEKGKLEAVAALSKEEARQKLFQKVEEESRQELIIKFKRIEEDEKKHAKETAKAILAEAIQKYAAEVAVETMATTVELPSDELKGRIIGKEGRNINAFEQITGVDVIVDDTPGSIVISGFDLVRRYIAKVALERLIADGRIHPARIEETVEKVKEEVNELIRELGEKAAYEVGITGLHPNLIKLLGRLKFRASHGQNVLKHSIEVALLAGSLAAEIGADVAICKKAGLLHDIGKGLDHEITGHHTVIGRDILKKFSMSEDITHAAEAHHRDPEPHTPEAMVVEAANVISRSRPGANKDNLDNFIKRMEEVEGLVSSFEGVEKVYAVQAGSEIRVFANPGKIDDFTMLKLANAITDKIETTLQYPGEIRVNVVREVRSEAYAE